MFDSNDLELIKQSSRYKLKYLEGLTKEELLLKSKYEELRKAKERLSGYSVLSNYKLLTKSGVIPKAIDLTKECEINSKKTTEFKNWSKQAQENDVKRLNFCSNTINIKIAINFYNISIYNFNYGIHVSLWP